MQLRWMFAALATALMLAACGGEAVSTTIATSVPAPTTMMESSTTSTTGAPATTTTMAEAADSEAVTFVGADGVESMITDTSRIVSLGGDITEILFELGLGDRVVAIDVTTTHPESAAALPVVGFAQQLAAEPVLAFEPTLVIGDEMTAPSEAIDQLRNAGIPVVILPTQSTLDGVSDKIDQVATIVSATEAGAELGGRVEQDIAAAQELLEGSAAEPPRVAYVYVRGEQLVLLFGQGIATNAMIVGAGAIDAGAESGVFGAVPMTPEALVAAAPDVIVLPEAGLAALGGTEAFAALPGVAETPAGENRAFLAYDEAYFFNLGPRAGLALETFINDLYSLVGGA